MYRKTRQRKRQRDLVRSTRTMAQESQKSNFSKVSQDLFWNIVKNLNDLSDIYFAQLDENKVLDESGNNNEVRLKLEKLILPDFIDMKQKKDYRI
jgi:hypothetical protein